MDFGSNDSNVLLFAAILSILTGFFVVRCSFMNYPNKYCHWYHRITGTAEIITGIMIIYTLMSGKSLFDF